MKAPLHEPDDALAVVLAAAPEPRTAYLPPIKALGLIVAADAVSQQDLPPFDRAMMDGWAVRCADAGRCVAVRDEIAAGDGQQRAPVSDGYAHPIMTGAPVPVGAEAVIPQEQTERCDQHVQLPATIRVGANIARCGTECTVGQTWLHRGDVVTPMTVAAAVGVGAAVIPVHPLPRVAILTTGSELSAGPLTAGHIHDSNGPMLEALVQEIGIRADRGTVVDDVATLEARLEILAGYDAVLLSGGVSTGTHDDVPRVLQRLGAEVIVYKIAQRPGKPLLVARRGAQMIFALPGNPLAAHLCACRYAVPVLRRLARLSDQPRVVQASLAAEIPANADRTWFIPACLDDANRAHPLLPVSSADFIRPHQANAYLRRPSQAPALPAGSGITATLIGAAAWTR